MAIEQAINHLNCEKENKIDRTQDSNYELVEASFLEKRKTTALKYSELELGGVYTDEKGKKWIFLGKGTLLRDGNQDNRTNDGVTYSEYMYVECPDDSIQQVAINEFQIGFQATPDTYSSKKRFFNKINQLHITPEFPIVFYYENEVFKMCNGLKPLSYYERME